MDETSSVRIIRSPSLCWWAFSGTEHPDNTSNVHDVRLRDGDDNWNNKDNNNSGVLPFRAFGGS